MSDIMEQVTLPCLTHLNRQPPVQDFTPSSLGKESLCLYSQVRYLKHLKANGCTDHLVKSVLVRFN